MAEEAPNPKPEEETGASPSSPAPKRSAAFRRELLKKLPSLTYERTGGTAPLRIADELGSITELDADAFLVPLKIPEKHS